jgi:hypothetical protein
MALDRPSFLVLGAGKAGTTSVVYYMSQHREVFFSYPKEPVFFQTEYELGMDYYWATYFKGYGGQTHAGEAAHQNLRLPYVARRVHQAVPDAKLILICRDPVERAFSAYWHNHTRKRDRRSFEDAVAENLERLRTGPFFEDEEEAKLYADAVNRRDNGGQVPFASYVDSGYYASHIERYASLFGRDRIKVLYFEDLARAPQEVADSVYAHLGLQPIELRDTAAQNTPIHPALAMVFRGVAALPGLSRIPSSWRAKVRTVLSLSFSSSKPEMRPETRRQLSEHFRPHNQRLAEITGRNLDHWS